HGCTPNQIALGGANLAAHHLRRKLRTYQALCDLNKAFVAVARNCHILENSGFMPIVKMNVFRGLVRELQSQISHDVVDKMHAVEDEDMFRFGQTRIEWEHYLNPDRLAFRKES